MSIVQISGQVKTAHRVKTASTALAINSLVGFTSGRLVAATSSTLIFGGIMCRAVTTASTDYASAIPILLVAPQFDTEYLLTTASASATTHVGNAYDLSDAVTLNLSGTTYKQFVVTEVLSTTLVKVKFNPAVVSFA